MNPYARDNVTRMKMVIRATPEEVWRMVATAEGLSKWLAASCSGEFVKYGEVRFKWFGDEDSRFIVFESVPMSTYEMGWFDRAKVRLTIEGDWPVTLTLKVTYQPGPDGKEAQAVELGPWAFALANLKSVILGGPDLRSKDPSLHWRESYID
jgi:uncharacterized protein YndB with AHSA1/START domain